MEQRNPPATAIGRARGTRQVYTEEAATMRKNPGTWYVLASFDPVEQPTGAVNLKNNIQHGRYAAFRPVGVFEATYAREDGKVNVYARYRAHAPNCSGSERCAGQCRAATAA